MQTVSLLFRKSSYQILHKPHATFARCLSTTRRLWQYNLPFKAEIQAPRLGDKIYVAMSGGVDSSVSAALLKQEGHDVEGIFMRNWVNDSKSPGGCSSDKDWKDVQIVAAQLEIPVTRVDLSKEYWIRVFEPALLQYERGNTPNPDIACNREIKFGALLDVIRKDYASKVNDQQRWWLATGHYARAVCDPRTSKTHLMRSKDSNKDQTYFLSTIEQAALDCCHFPLGNYTKPEVRQLAESMHLHNAAKEDSQGLCFVSPETRHFRDFLSSYLSPGPVRYVNQEGKTLGQDNRGFWASTIGERSGLQLPQGSASTQGKWFVSAKNITQGTVELVKGWDNSRLYKRGAVSTDWIWTDYPGSPDKLSVQLRHRQEPIPCIVHHYGGGNVGVFFQEAQRSVTPGQHLAVYSGDICLGGGTILESIEGLDELGRMDWQTEGLNPLGL